ncbi:nonaspanin [Chloropicon primus]|nr:nonaspanin [Chloropicon primus]
MVVCVVCCLAMMGAEAVTYENGETVSMFANKVGPFNNPSETYEFYNFPFCEAEKKKEKLLYLGEVLEGDRLVNTPFKIGFKEDKPDEKLCSQEISAEQHKLLKHAIENDYYFQMFFDHLPLWGFIGKVDKGHEVKLFLHTHFDVHYNGNRVIEINVATDPSRVLDLTESLKLGSVTAEFSYSVKWKETNIKYENRLDKYSRFSFLKQHLEIHWFSIINSIVTVLLLTGFLATILMRVLKNDFMKYTNEDLEADDEDESGWKLVHGDVFRFPENPSLLAAIVGIGTQFLVLTLCIFILSMVGIFYPYNRGAILTSFVVLYALTSGLAGYCSGLLFKQLGGKNWVRNNILTSGLFIVPLFLVFSVNNSIAWNAGTTAALPFGTICIMVVIWALVTMPLSVLGGIFGKNSKLEFNAPSRANKYAREIPSLPWYRSTIPQMVMAGFLPFSAIYIELYYIFASVWGHKVYTIYSILFIVFLILIVVTAFITIALTYFQLAAEDYHWWWRSILCGGSTGFYILGYCYYYFYYRSEMDGLMQTSFYFGYMGLVCYAFFMMLGMVGFRASQLFVRSIYRAIKCD